MPYPSKLDFNEGFSHSCTRRVGLTTILFGTTVLFAREVGPRLCTCRVACSQHSEVVGTVFFLNFRKTSKTCPYYLTAFARSAFPFILFDGGKATKIHCSFWRNRALPQSQNKMNVPPHLPPFLEPLLGRRIGAVGTRIGHVSLSCCSHRGGHRQVTLWQSSMVSVKDKKCHGRAVPLFPLSFGGEVVFDKMTLKSRLFLESFPLTVLFVFTNNIFLCFWLEMIECTRRNPDFWGGGSHSSSVPILLFVAHPFP